MDSKICDKLTDSACAREKSESYEYDAEKMVVLHAKSSFGHHLVSLSNEVPTAAMCVHVCV